MENLQDEKLIDTINGIDIYFTPLQEYDMSFEHWDECLKNDTIKLLASGDLVVFVAKVTAKKNGIHLCDEYLGQCIYKDFDEFASMDGYCDDMKQAAHENGKVELERIIKALQS